MNPINFPEANVTFGPPKDLVESQCKSIRAFQGTVSKGSIDGAPFTVVAWQPDEGDLDLIRSGQPIFLVFIGGLPPHYVCTSFQQAINFG